MVSFESIVEQGINKMGTIIKDVGRTLAMHSPLARISDLPYTSLEGLGDILTDSLASFLALDMQTTENDPKASKRNICWNMGGLQCGAEGG